MSSSVDDLLTTAHDEGALSGDSLRALQVSDIGDQIQAALGIEADLVTSGEVVLVSMLIDDSSSIAQMSNTDAVMQGHNIVLDSLAASKQKDGVLVHCRYLNGTVLYPYCPLDGSVRMTASNYNPNLGTPLYDESVVMLATVLAKTQQFSDQGIPTRAITLIVTDGEDLHSVKQEAKDVARLVGDMLATEQHIVAGFGVRNSHIDFIEVFRNMGIEDRWILTSGSTSKEIREAFTLFSQSAVRVSQAGATFSKVAAGGFTSP